MRILHTADWHLGDRLQHIDRSSELQRAVERIAGYAVEEHVDVVLVAGDLFSDLARADSVQRSVQHLAEVFRSFLLQGGTIVALTGNHDNECFCEILGRAFQLAAPTRGQAGRGAPARQALPLDESHVFPTGDGQGQAVQFVCLPYPRPRHYLDRDCQNYATLREKHRALRAAVVERLKRLQGRLDPKLPSVLAAHLYVVGSLPHKQFHLRELQDVIVGHSAFTSGWAYTALGHLHKPQTILGLPQVRYSGSIERLDIGERDDQKGAVLVEIGASGLASAPLVMPLPATTFYDVRISNPREELPQLAAQYPDAKNALVRCHIDYRSGEDNLYEILEEVARIFPRCYERSWKTVGTSASRDQLAREERNASTPASAARQADPDDGESGSTSVEQIVLRYLRSQLADDPDRDELLALAERLLEETL